MDQGLILVYTGNGKGKTTAAIGLGVRAVGHNKKVSMIQFMKGQNNTGELTSLKKLDNFSIKQAGRDNFITDQADPMDIQAAQAGFNEAKQEVKKVDVLILDEINMAMDFGLIEVDDVLNFINNKPKHVDLILTGRNFPQELAEYVDMISEVLEVKHHYNSGVMARKGIEY